MRGTDPIKSKWECLILTMYEYIFIHFNIVCYIIQLCCILSYKIICLICTIRYMNNIVYIDLGTILSNERLEVIKTIMNSSNVF